MNSHLNRSGSFWVRSKLTFDSQNSVEDVVSAVDDLKDASFYLDNTYTEIESISFSQGNFY